MFAIGQTKSHGTYNYCDGTIGFIARHGDPYEAHFPGDGWVQNNPVNSNYSFFTTAANANKWHRITYVYSRSEVCLYVDGILTCKWSASGISGVLAALNQGHLVIGAGASEGELENFGGYVDDVYVYSGALDSTAVSAIGKGTQKPGQPTTPTTPTKPTKPNTNGGIQKKAASITVSARNYKHGTKSLYLVKGKTAQLRAVVLPAKAKQGAVYKSSATKIATVTQSGKIKGKKAGTAKITITSADGVKKTTITVKVVKKAKVNKKLSLKSKKKIVLKKKNAASQIKTKGLTAKTTSIETYKVIKGKKYIKVDKYGKISCKVKPTKKAKKAEVKVTCGKKSIVIKITIKK